MSIDDIPVVLEEDALLAVDQLLDVPIELTETFYEEAPVLGDEEDNGNVLPIWEAIEMDARADEDDTSIRTCKIEGCCAKRCSNNFTLYELLQYNFDRNVDYYSEGTNLLDLIILGEIRAMSRSSDDSVQK